MISGEWRIESGGRETRFPRKPAEVHAVYGEVGYQRVALTVPSQPPNP
jgi:hypothetical protein